MLDDKGFKTTFVRRTASCCGDLGRLAQAIGGESRPRNLGCKCLTEMQGDREKSTCVRARTSRKHIGAQLVVFVTAAWASASGPGLPQPLPNPCEMLTRWSDLGVARAFRDASLPAVAEIVNRWFGGVVVLPQDASEFGLNAPLFASVETLNENGYVVRYTWRRNCADDSACQFARISARRPAPGPQLEGRAVQVNPELSGSVQLGELSTVAFDDQGVRFSIAVVRTDEVRLIAIARRLLAPTASYVQYLRPQPGIATPSPSPSPSPSPRPSQTPESMRPLLPVAESSPAPSVHAQRRMTLDFQPHAASAGQIVTVQTAEFHNVLCVILGQQSARFSVLWPGRLSVVVPANPLSGGLTIFADGMSISTGGFTALPDPTQPHHTGISPSTYTDAQGLSVPSARSAPEFLVPIVQALRIRTRVPIVLPRQIPHGAVSAHLENVDQASYNVTYLDDGGVAVASFAVAKEWLYSGPAYWATNPPFGGHRQLFNGTLVGYAPYTCEPTCGDSQLAWAYRGMLVTARMHAASWTSLRSLADSVESFGP